MYTGSNFSSHFLPTQILSKKSVLKVHSFSACEIVSAREGRFFFAQLFVPGREPEALKSNFIYLEKVKGEWRERSPASGIRATKTRLRIVSPFFARRQIDVLAQPENRGIEVITNRATRHYSTDDLYINIGFLQDTRTKFNVRNVSRADSY